jgi:signal transduction histidine kinase
MEPILSRLRSLTRRQFVEISALLLLMLAAVKWALFMRHFLRLPPFSVGDLNRLQFDPFGSGIAMQTVAMPLALLYLFSNTSLFRRTVTGETRSHDKLKLFGSLLVIQLVTLIYNFWIFPIFRDMTTVGLLIVVVGGLLAGWSMGLGLSLSTAVISGTIFLLIESGGHFLFLEEFQVTGLRAFLFWPLWRDFLFYLLGNLRVSMVIWAGLAAGLCADLFRPWRFTPVFALALGVLLELGAGSFVALTVERLVDFARLLVATAPITGIALATVALAVRVAQADSVRQKADLAELALARAELHALRAQINPHFLFNALNTIRYCVRTDPKNARRLLLDLSEVFQRVLRSGEFVPLRDELGYVKSYLSLEEARLGERLRVRWDGILQSEPQNQNESLLLEQFIPTLTLQPIVENAVVHGIGKRPEGGTITIRVAQSDQHLILEVQDDGIGIEPLRLPGLLKQCGENETCIGLRNVDKRLRLLYREDYRLLIESEAGRGTRVSIRIPMKSAQ